MLVNLLLMTKTGSMLYQERLCDVDWHLLHLTLTILLSSQITNSFGRPLSQVTVSTIFSLLKPSFTVLISFVRGNIHICFPLFNIHSLKTLISIDVYLNMCNPPIVILCSSSLLFYPASWVHIVHVLCFVFYFFYISFIFNLETVYDCRIE